jgi:hypothetical protein
MNNVIESTKYLNEVKFMNAVRKAGIRVNTKTGYQSRFAVTVELAFTADGLYAYNREEKEFFTLTNLTVLDAQKLNAAGFEVRFVETFRSFGSEMTTVATYGKAVN